VAVGGALPTTAAATAATAVTWVGEDGEGIPSWDIPFPCSITVAEHLREDLAQGMNASV
jgi:hypothetical protein